MMKKFKLINSRVDWNHNTLYDIKFLESMTVREFIDEIREEYHKITVDVIADNCYMGGHLISRNYGERYDKHSLHLDYYNFLSLGLIDGEIVSIESQDYSRVSKMTVKRAQASDSGIWMNFTLRLDDAKS